MAIKPRRSTRVRSHDVHVRFGDHTYSALGDFSARSGLALNASVRLLVERGLVVEEGHPVGDGQDQLAQQLKTLADSALAGLIALEQNQRLLVAMTPDGDEVIERLWDEAATSARRRLMRVERAVTEESA